MVNTIPEFGMYLLYDLENKINQNNQLSNKPSSKLGYPLFYRGKLKRLKSCKIIIYFFKHKYI